MNELVLSQKHREGGVGALPSAKGEASRAREKHPSRESSALRAAAACLPAA